MPLAGLIVHFHFIYAATDRQLCAELTQKKRRLVEERELLSTDMKSCMKFYCLKVETLNSRIKDFGKFSSAMLPILLYLQKTKDFERPPSMDNLKKISTRMRSKFNYFINFFIQKNKSQNQEA